MIEPLRYYKNYYETILTLRNSNYFNYSHNSYYLSQIVTESGSLVLKFFTLD